MDTQHETPLYLVGAIGFAGVGGISRRKYTTADLTVAQLAEEALFKNFTAEARTLRKMRARGLWIGGFFDGIVAGARDQLVKYDILEEVSPRRQQARAVAAAKEALMEQNKEKMKIGNTLFVPTSKNPASAADEKERFKETRARHNAIILARYERATPKRMFTATLRGEPTVK